MSHLRFTDIDPKIEQQVDNLLAQMTLEEKVGQMIQIDLRRQGIPESEKRIKAGQVGSLLTLYDIDEINRLQKMAREESRLGIPFILGNDVIHGFRTIFPIPLAESCTWDPDLLEETARIASEEASANGTDWIFAPMVDVCRDPRWGRIAEGSGEDPYLGSVLARARVRGFQADNLASGRKIVACPKHFTAYGWAEAGKDYNTVDVSERTLRDVILPPFKAAFDEGAGTLMSAFNELNGVPISANTFILRQILRDEWDYTGMVLSDYDAVQELMPHGMAADLKDAARLSILGGVDMDMVSDGYHLHLAELVQEGVVPETLLDDAVRRILRVKFILGLFDDPYVDKAAAQQAILKPEYKETALDVTQKSMVLLKNKSDLLPLDANGKRIALIGPLADDHHEVLGTWHRIGRDEDVESVLDGLNTVLPESAQLTHVRGCDIDGKEEANFTEAEAVAAAQSADVAIVVLGETEQMSGEAHSLAHLDLPGHQLELLQAVHATGTPTVVILMSGRPLVIPWLAENVPAILQAWHGGIRTGRAVANILLGHTNPSGKLTAGWPRTEGQIPVYYAHKNTGRPVESEGAIQFNKVHRSNYLDAPNSPQYPFGFGLSYTTFAYSNLQVETPTLGLNDTLVVSVNIANTGKHAGDEIVQLYVRDLVGSVTRPVKELKGFEKISLDAGQQKTVEFKVPIQELGFHGLAMKYVVEPGAFKVWVGPNSAEGLEGKFEVVA